VWKLVVKPRPSRRHQRRARLNQTLRLAGAPDPGANHQEGTQNDGGREQQFPDHRG
jgi:hypothetical protein